MKQKKLSGRRLLVSLLVIILIPLTTLFAARSAGGRSYYLVSVLIIVYTMIPFFMVFEGRKPQARELVILAVMCAIAVISRVLFIWIPHFKPMVAIIMITGIAFGPEAGFLCGAISGFVSNFLFGQGPLTPWQMFAYGMGGFVIGLLYRLGLLKRKPIPLAVAGALCVMIVVGPLLDTGSLLVMAAEVTAESAAAIYLSGVPVNLIHAAATALTMLLVSNPMFEKLDRIQMKYGMMEGKG